VVTTACASPSPFIETTSRPSASLDGRDEPVRLVCVSLGLGPVNRPLCMLGRGIDRVETKINRPSVHHVVAQTRRHVHETVWSNRAFLAFQDGDALALDEGKDLVDTFVHFLAVLPAWWDRHHDDLGIRASREDVTKEDVRFRRRDDVDVESHGAPLVRA